MKTEYTPDNTRSSMLVLLLLATAVIVLALLFGLSDKPQVDKIGVVAGQPVDASSTAAGASMALVEEVTPSIAFDSNTEAAGTELATDDDAGLIEAEADSAADTTADRRAEAIAIPTLEPTPEVAAAVEPTPVPETNDQSAESVGSVQAAPSLPTTSGSVQGSFFTKGDENDGAVVSQNLITVSFAEDGSGAFQGVLDITYLDGTHILLNMSGPLTWAPSNPQVVATLDGAFTYDAPIDADDITSDVAELSISTLANGSGSLCTVQTKCFGFTFPAQNGL